MMRQFFAESCLRNSNRCEENKESKPVYEIIDHYLYRDGELVDQRPSPNHGRAITPRLVVIHYTGDNSCEGALSWLCAAQSGVSSHLVVDKDGTVYQLLPFHVAAWHAGRSEYNGEPGVNSFSVGIENVGIGDSFTDEQYEANRGIIAALFNYYPIEDVKGHEDVAIPPGRKTDPGVNFDWSRVVDYV
jgi:N-acetylmuramoyl-L-alanine amidase